MEVIQDRFNPVQYSLAECQFLLDHLGEPPFKALQSIRAVPLPNPNPKDKNPVWYPDGVIPASVMPILTRVYELIDLEAKGVMQWVGLDVLRETLSVYISEQAKWLRDKQRYPRAPRFPSMHSFDGKNRPHKGGPGSDSGVVSTYLDKDGKRVPFAVDLVEARETGGWVPEWAAKPGPTMAAVDVPVSATKAIVDDAENNRFECPICKHTESYKADSQSSRNAARGRMSKHLRTDTRETSLHRELYTNEFGE